MNDTDTIAAIATPPGTGGIGIVRISGLHAISILSFIFKLKSGRLPVEFEHRRLYYGNIIDENGKVLDECMAVVMKAPKSYTKEQVSEIHCHGGSMPLKAILDLIIRKGARLALPGEFTKRAFLSGRIDLTQAEAVMDVINASTEKSFEASALQLEGKLGNVIKLLKEKLLDLLAGIEASVDYPDELSGNDVNVNLYAELEKVLKNVNELIATFDYGRTLRQGFKVAIVGKPNVGKSSLLNALLKNNRAIVTSIPGTTRDIIEEMLNIKGVPVKIVDTAGIRGTTDIIESIGIERAKNSIYEADLVIVMIDASLSITDEDRSVFKATESKKTMFVLNKIDIGDIAAIEELKISNNDALIVKTSIIKGIGIAQVEQSIFDSAFLHQVNSKQDIIIVNARHKQALSAATASLTDAMSTLRQNLPVDLTSIDIMGAWQALASITGENLGEELIDRIFSKFCLGK